MESLLSSAFRNEATLPSDTQAKTKAPSFKCGDTTVRGWGLLYCINSHVRFLLQICLPPGLIILPNSPHCLPLLDAAHAKTRTVRGYGTEPGLGTGTPSFVILVAMDEACCFLGSDHCGRVNV